MSLLVILVQLMRFYELLIVVYVLMSWFRPSSGLLFDIYRTLGTIVEPWIGLFRRIMPRTGMLDFSPLVAIIVLQVLEQIIARLLFR
ncbi:MAG: YggT family protein [Coriobacteriia bacterium]